MITGTLGNETASSSIDHGQREDRVAGMDEHGQAAAVDEQLHQRVNGRVVRQVAVDQRVELETEELRMVEEAFDLLDVARHARVAPDEPVRLGDRLDHRANELVVRVEDAAALVLVLLDHAVPARPGRARR